MSISAPQERSDSMLPEVACGVLVVDSGGFVSYLNEAGAELLEVGDGGPAGYSVDDLYARFMITDEEGASVKSEDTPTMQVLTGATKENQRLLCLTSSDGAMRWLDVKATSVDIGEDVMSVSIFMDVTNLRQDGEHDYLQPDLGEAAVVITDHEGTALYQNQVATRLFAPDIEFLDEEGLPLPDEEVPGELVRSGASERSEAILRYEEDGSYRWLEMKASAVRSKSGDLSMVIAISEDITPQREREDEFEDLRNALQESVHPIILPPVGGVDVGAVFRPHGGGIGGDFYDVLELGEEEWLFFIGDVGGRGAEVLALAAFCRATLRALALHQTSLNLLLQEFNQALLHYHNEGHFITVALAKMRSTDSGADFEVVLGGHPQPRLLRSGGTVEEVGQPGALVGAFQGNGNGGGEGAPVSLGPGDALIFYTDGVSEARNDSGERFDLEAALCAHQGLDAPTMAEILEEDISAWAGRRGDVSLLIAHVTEAPVFRQRFPAEMATIPAVRHALADLRERYPSVPWDEVNLLATELATNALTHGLSSQGDERWLEVLVTERAGRRLRFSVLTPGAQFDAFKNMRVSDLSDPSGRGLFLVDNLASRWGVGENDGCLVWFECDLLPVENTP